MKRLPDIHAWRRLLVGQLALLSALLPIFLPIDLHAQLPPPISIDLRFRLYGRDAKPVKEKEYTVFGLRNHVRWMGDGKAETTVDGADLHVTFNAYDPSRERARFGIVHAGDTMHVASSVSLDSLPFMPGMYVIPNGFDLLLNEVRTGRARVVPGWPELRVESLDSLPPNLGITDQPMLRFVSGELHPGEPTTYGYGIAAANVIPGTNVIVMAYQGRPGERHILFSSDSCESWPTRREPPADEGYFIGVKFVDLERGWVQLLNKRNEIRYSMTTDHGRNWMTSDYPPSWARDDASGYSPYGRELPRSHSLDGSTRFDVLWDQSTTCTLTGTTDGGRTWETLFSAPSNRPGVLRFLNDRVGVLLLSRAIFLTRDAGATWRFVPMLAGRGPLTRDFSDPEARTLFDDFFFINEGAICVVGPTAIWWMNLPPV